MAKAIIHGEVIALTDPSVMQTKITTYPRLM